MRALLSRIFELMYFILVRYTRARITLVLWCSTSLPTSPFAIPEPYDQEIGEFYVVQECLVTDFGAPKLGKSRSVGFFRTMHVIPESIIT